MICGSIAYDSIMVFPGRFADHILPHQVHILNVAFLVPQLRREFGGCAGNIAYNVKLLGGQAVADGHGRRRFAALLRTVSIALQISRRFVLEVGGHLTAQAFITTDVDNNQITAFHPGAMSDSHRNEIPGDGSIKLGIVAPDGREGMLQHAEQFAEHGIPFVFDPGQGLPMFSGEELSWFIDRASYVAVNDYEGKMLERPHRNGRCASWPARCSALIVTHGAAGSQIFMSTARSCRFLSRRRAIRSIPPAAAMPTGPACWWASQNEMDWETIGKSGGNDGLDKNRALRRSEPYGRSQFDCGTVLQAFGYRPW